MPTERLDIRARHAAIALLAATLVSCAAPASAPRPAEGERLPTDPVLVTGALENGLAYIIRPHANPPGRVAVWLHVASGSLNETEDTRGLAHFLEHMAFNGSANFPPGSRDPVLPEPGHGLRARPERLHQPRPDHLQLALPDTKPETLDHGLLFLSDVACAAHPRPREDRSRAADHARGEARAGRVVGSAWGTTCSSGWRPGPLSAARLPIGTEETIRAVRGADFRDYYARWYVPSNMTVIMVGDLAPPDAVAAIARHFGAMPRRPRPEPRPVGVTATPGRAPSSSPTPS